MIERIFRRKKWRCQVVVAFPHEHPQKRIVGHCVAQSLGDVYISILVRLVTPRLHAAGQIFVKEVALKLQIAAHVIVKRCGVRANNRREARIVIGPRARRIFINSRKTAVESSHCAALVAQQLLVEAHDLDAQIAAVDVLRGKPRQPRKFLRNLRAARGPQSSAIPGWLSAKHSADPRAIFCGTRRSQCTSAKTEYKASRFRYRTPRSENSESMKSK